MISAYYNENEPKAAAWLRELIKAGHIAPGEVDERSIVDIRPSELAGFVQCHFFAGVGVWSYALRRAGWPDNRPVWTGSCPCQPFSAAGKGGGFDDERHLWPAWYHLIGERGPAKLFGEQVASKNADVWIDLVQADLEALGYAFGAVPFPSAGIGAPHIRDRTYWLADAADVGLSTGPREQSLRHGEGQSERPDGAGRLADTDGGNASAEWQQRGWQQRRQPQDGRSLQDGWTGPVNGIWRDADWLHCRDDKWRPVEPGTFPLAHGAPARVGRLRGYGNAINAEAAVAFIEAATAHEVVDLEAAA
jgi:DNA (cytosine-5)-methyltransferase 1